MTVEIEVPIAQILLNLVGRLPVGLVGTVDRAGHPYPATQAARSQQRREDQL